jgi:hypothetical protein
VIICTNHPASKHRGRAVQQIMGSTPTDANNCKDYICNVTILSGNGPLVRNPVARRGVGQRQGTDKVAKQTSARSLGLIFGTGGREQIRSSAKAPGRRRIQLHGRPLARQIGFHVQVHPIGRPLAILPFEGFASRGSQIETSGPGFGPAEARARDLNLKTP